MKAFFTLVLATLLAWHPDAHALACGDTVSSDTTLTADLHCTSGWNALYLPIDGVTLRLNGHTLSGDIALAGVSVSNARNVRILGPGRITGFWTGVNATGADYLTVQGVDFDNTNAGVIASDTLGTYLQGNDFRNIDGWGIYIAAPAGSRPVLGAHAIADNLVLESVGGIFICGHANSDNLLKNNTLQGLRDYGIHLLDGSGNNEIRQNQLLKIDTAGLVLRGSRANTVKGNKFDHGATGIAMIPQFSGGCPTGPYASPDVRDNLIDGNSIFKQGTGIAAGLGGKGAWVLKNRIGNNKLYYDGTGIRFNTDTYANDATLNAYSGTTTPVSDSGLANTW
ncbi:MAG: NosD domain-containing protein [Pseudoxanthomonas sp.]